MLGLRRLIHFEAVLPVEADGSLIVLDDVQPHRAILSQPFRAASHQRIGNTLAVKGWIDHHPVQLAVVRGMDRRDHESGEHLAHKGRREELMLVCACVERRLGGNSYDAAVRFELFRTQAVDVKGRAGRAVGERSDVGGRNPFESCGVVQKVNQFPLRY